LAQDERNAHIFYTHFSTHSQDINAKGVLATLAKDSQTRLEQYTTLLSQHFDCEFTPNDTNINTSIPLADAITLALTEESKALITLGNLLEAADYSIEKILERVISRKIVGQQLLLTLRR